MDDTTEQAGAMARNLSDVETQTLPKHEEQSFDISDWTTAIVQTWLKSHNLQHLQIWYDIHTESALITMGVSVAQRLGRRTYDPAVMRSIPGPGVIRHLGQLSLPSLRGGYI